jgi:cephalosporin hydroxylase
MNDDAGELGVNAERLRELVKTIHHGFLIDLGVQYGGSSRILLTEAVERDNHVVGVDASPFCQFPSHPNYQSMVADSVTYLSGRTEPIDLCFHDTMHVAEQVMCELYYAWPLLKIGGYCVLHDTNWPLDKHDVYCGRAWGQPIAGVLKFFHVSDCVEMVNYPESWGMTFAKKLNDHDPRVGVDFGPAFDAHKKLTT